MKSLPKKNRHTSYKIPDIKAIRSLTRLLGKLEIPGMHWKYEDLGYADYCRHAGLPIDEEKKYVRRYGYGLAEAKAFVERWFNYTQELSPTETAYVFPPRN